MEDGRRSIDSIRVIVIKMKTDLTDETLRPLDGAQGKPFYRPRAMRIFADLIFDTKQSASINSTR